MLLGLAVEVLLLRDAAKVVHVGLFGRETQGGCDLGDARGEGFCPVTLLPLVVGEAGFPRVVYAGGRGRLGGGCCRSALLMHGGCRLAVFGSGTAKFGKHDVGC